LATYGINSGLIRGNPAAPYGIAPEQTGDPVQHQHTTALEACRTAISVEFVTKPNFAQHVRAMVPAAVNQTFAGVNGFAGCALLVSDQEERLITLLTFWQGRLESDALAHNSRWVCKLLEPYMDHKLRIRTLRSQLAILPATPATSPVTSIVAAESLFESPRARVA